MLNQKIGNLEAGKNSKGKAIRTYIEEHKVKSPANTLRTSEGCEYAPKHSNSFKLHRAAPEISTSILASKPVADWWFSCHCQEHWDNYAFQINFLIYTVMLIILN